MLIIRKFIIAEELEKKLHSSINDICEYKLNYVLKEINSSLDEDFLKGLEENLEFAISIIKQIIFIRDSDVHREISDQIKKEIYKNIRIKITNFQNHNRKLLSAIGIANNFICIKMKEIDDKCKKNHVALSAYHTRTYKCDQDYTKDTIFEWQVILEEYLDFIFLVLAKFKKKQEKEDPVRIVIGDS